MIILLGFVTSQILQFKTWQSSHPLTLFVIKKFSSWERYLLTTVVQLLKKKQRKKILTLFSVQISRGKWINSTFLILAAGDLHQSAFVIVYITAEKSRK